MLLGRCTDNWFLGSNGATLGSTIRDTADRFLRTAGTRLLYGRRWDDARCWHGWTTHLHLRRAKDGRPHPEAGEQFEVHDEGCCVYD